MNHNIIGYRQGIYGVTIWICGTFISWHVWFLFLICYKTHTRNIPGGDTVLVADVGGDRIDAGNNLRKTSKKEYFKKDVLYKPQEK